ncbi:hypothetical protein [Nocardioides sp. CER19]|uniref:hypothetical protein n=1 Tax=Nocardioides sp. CER19 TaxID=3038538 RepID=UPI00244A04A2|nr:hypothetical protein [Nocardioides sp. CER19]MDH2415565.1 hypothetical protein [Nocardioides sp. CER19]
MSEDQSYDSQEPVRTGVPAVDAVLDAVEQAAELPADEQVAVFERAHEQLRRALDGRADEPS